MRLKTAYKKAKNGSITKSSTRPGSHVVGMPGGGEIKYIPPTQGRIYNDNTKVATPPPLPPTTPEASISSFLKDKEYQSPKYTPKKEVNSSIKRILNSADLATDVLQLGHFSPDPFMIGQTAGLVGDVVGAGVDAIQSGIAAYEGNTKDAAVNAGLALLPSITKKFGYERSASLMTGKGSGMYRPLTATTPSLANNPVIKKGLNWNRATLGANAIEVANSNKSPKMPNGGVIPIPLADYDKTMAPKKGNYLLPDVNRPSYIDSEGGRRSEYKMGVNINGEEVVIPTVVNGRQLTGDEAIQRYQETGLHMGKHKTPNEGEYQSRLRTAKYNMLEDPIRYNPSSFRDGGKYLPTAVSQQLAKRPSSGLKEAYKRRKRL